MPTWSLKGRIVLINVAVVSLTLSLLALYFVRSQQQLLETTLIERGTVATQQLAYLTRTALDYLPPEDIQASLEELAMLALEERSVRAVKLRHPALAKEIQAGPVMLAATTELSERPDSVVIIQQTDASIRFLRPIDLGKEAPSRTSTAQQEDCTVEIEYANHPVVIHMFEVLITAGAIALSSIIALIALALYSTRQYGQKFSRIVSATQQFTEQKQNQKVHIALESERDELDILAQNLNRMWEQHRLNRRDRERTASQTTQDLRETLEILEVQNIELDLARKEAVDASVMKSEFLANTSHEIRTPLNGIVGFSNLLLQTPMDGKQIDYAKTIQQSANGLMRIINDILDFSKIEAGKLALDSADVNLQDLLESTLGLLAPMTLDKDVQLNSAIHPEVPAYIRLDGARLQQVITNLVHNAIKFTDAGHVSISVQCSDNNSLAIAVEDSGIGLSEEQQTRLFNAFTQASQSISGTYGGSGLGLIIAQRLVQLMGGEIELLSEAGEGTQFKFKVPFEISTRSEQEIDFKGLTAYYYEHEPSKNIASLLKRWNMKSIAAASLTDLYGISQNSSRVEPSVIIACLQKADFERAERIDILQEMATDHHCIFVCAENLLATSLQSLQGEHSHVLTIPVKRQALLEALLRDRNPEILKRLGNDESNTQKRVLLVDDYEPNLKLLTIMLQQYGHEVLPVKSGVEAINCCNHEQFSVIFMDIQMPEISGIEATQLIRTESRMNKATPVIAVTAHADSEERREMLSAGFNDHLGKPIMDDALIATLRKWNQYPEQRAIETTASQIGGDTERASRSVSESPVDLKSCLELSGNRTDVAQELLSQLLEQLQTNREAINSSLAADDIKTYRERVHRLHGHACYTGVPNLRRLCNDIESLVTANKTAQAKQANLLLNEEIDRLLDWREQHDLAALFGD